MSSEQTRRWALEALVIVASILLAFALDAGWDERVRVRELRADLGAVRSELFRAVGLLERGFGFHNVRAAVLEDIGQDLAAAEVGSEVIIPAGRLGLLMPQHTSDLNTITVDNFLSRGGLDLLPEDAALALQLWPATVEDLVDDQRRIRETKDRETLPLLRTSGDLRPAVQFWSLEDWLVDGGPEEGISIRVSRELRNLFAEQQALERLASTTLQEACLVAVDIVVAINQEIPAVPFDGDSPCAQAPLPEWLEDR